MRERPYKNPPKQCPVGLAISPSHVIGEWNGKTWDRVPANAKLYIYELENWWPLFLSGEAAIRRWVHLDDNNNRSRGSKPPSSIIWRGFLLYSTRDILSGKSHEQAFSGLVDFASFLRENGAYVGSFSSACKGLWKATLKGPVSEWTNELPSSFKQSLILGSRQDFIGPGTFDNCEIWDIQAAYAHALGTLEIPRRWKEYLHLPDAGICQAEVTIPFRDISYGPLPIKEGNRLSFPRGQNITGFWTIDEIKSAVLSGAKVTVIRAWGPGSNTRQVFKRWWELVSYARTELSPVARQIFKVSSNALWGNFGMGGRTWEWYYSDGKPQKRPVGGIVRPRNTLIPALVAGKVRSRLYSEALARWPIVSCHTDGVISMVPLAFDPAGNGPGTWRLVDRARRLDILGPQVIRYIRDSDGTERYKIAGRVIGRNYDVENSFQRWYWEALRPQTVIDERNEKLAILKRMGI